MTSHAARTESLERRLADELDPGDRPTDDELSEVLRSKMSDRRTRNIERLQRRG